MAKPNFATLVLGITTLVSGCGGGGSEPPPDGGTSVAMATPSGDAQTGIVGQVLVDPISIVVTTDGAAAAGVTVNWSTAAAGGELTPAAAATDANGVASTTWTLGTTAGPQTASATVT